MVDMDKIVSLCKRRGFIFQSSEIYGGTGSVWDYGPLGVELKNNVKRVWWHDSVQNRADMVGLDASILMHPRVWQASGHLDHFTDPMVDCRACNRRFRADKIDPVRYKEFVVSSTRVRRLVTEGRMDEAGALLGHQFYIDGVVVEGKRRGREIGFPTANLKTENELLPPSGVYATTVTIDGVVHPSISNIGVRPTFGDSTNATVEAYVMGYSGDLYGQQVRLGFVQRLRDERKFEDVDALRAQIEADRRRAERLFAQLSV